MNIAFMSYSEETNQVTAETFIITKFVGIWERMFGQNEISLETDSSLK